MIDEVDDGLGDEEDDGEDKHEIEEASELRLIESGLGVLAVEVRRCATELKWSGWQVGILPLL